MDELRNALEGDDMDEEFYNDLHAAMLESLRYSNENDNHDEKQDDKKDDKKDNTMNEEKVNELSSYKQSQFSLRFKSIKPVVLKDMFTTKKASLTSLSFHPYYSVLAVFYSVSS